MIHPPMPLEAAGRTRPPTGSSALCRSRVAVRCAGALLALSAFAASPVVTAQTVAAPPAQVLEEVPYVKTPEPVVDAILGLGDIRPGDRLIDLGSGDGRIVIAAARRFGIRALGVEIDPALVDLSNTRAAEAGVADRVRFAAQDLFETDLRDASVITLYLLPDVNLALRPRLLALAPGTRIVSHDWDMGDWRPDRSVEVDAPGKTVGLFKRSKVHRWTVPARLDGRWRVRLGDATSGPDTPLRITQRFQDIEVTMQDTDGTTWQGQGRIEGERVRFALQAGARVMRFEGQTSDGRIAGELEHAGARSRWSAARD